MKLSYMQALGDGSDLLTASAIAFVLSWLVLLILRRFPILDIPEAGRSSHRVSTPTSGGLSFITGLLGAVAYLYIQNFSGLKTFYYILLGAALTLSTVGFMDEFKEISFIKRLIAQFIVSSVLLIMAPLELGIESVLLVVLLAGFINATNFCDGLNGLLGTGVMIAMVFFGLAIPNLAPFLFPLCAGIFSFLIFNWQGKIFMGDVGSFFLGLYVPALLLMEPNLLLNILLLGHLLFIYILDISLTIARRLLQRQTVVRPHRDFYFHHLRDMGLHHLAITSIYGFFTLFQGLTMYLMRLEGIKDYIYLYIFDFALYGSLLSVIYSTSMRFKKLNGDVPKS